MVEWGQSFEVFQIERPEGFLIDAQILEEQRFERTDVPDRRKRVELVAKGLLAARDQTASTLCRPCLDSLSKGLLRDIAERVCSEGVRACPAVPLPACGAGVYHDGFRYEVVDVEHIVEGKVGRGADSGGEPDGVRSPVVLVDSTCHRNQTA